MKISPAGRLAILHELTDPVPVYDQYGDLLGYTAPVLDMTSEEILNLLLMKEDDNE